MKRWAVGPVGPVGSVGPVGPHRGPWRVLHGRAAIAKGRAYESSDGAVAPYLLPCRWIRSLRTARDDGHRPTFDRKVRRRVRRDLAGQSRTDSYGHSEGRPIRPRVCPGSV